MNTFSMIMAGGGGTRFWPLSRQDLPKQLLNLSGNDIMINETIKRCKSLISPENTFIVTNIKQAEMMEKTLLPEIPKENILKEPVARNTASCILYAAMHMYAKHGDGVLCVFPSDHYITDEVSFLKILNNAIYVASKSERSVTIGVNPKFPSTGYGYIKRTSKMDYENTYTVDQFVEKPNLEMAKQYVSSGEYYWNSGIFIWKLSVILELFQRFLPRIYNKLKELEPSLCTNDEKRVLEHIYPKLESISVDYGIMERLDNALVIPGEFGWNDVGSWDVLGEVFPSDQHGNIIKAEHVYIDTKECIIYGNDKLIATVGIYNTIIVETSDALLVCAKEKAQDVKQIVDKLRASGKTELL